MIIRDQGIVVGMLDDSTLELEGVTSTKLQELVDGWRKNGFQFIGPPEEEIEESDEAPDSEDTLRTLPFTKENLGVVELELWKAGFEVQRA